MMVLRLPRIGEMAKVFLLACKTMTSRCQIQGCPKGRSSLLHHQKALICLVMWLTLPARVAQRASPGCQLHRPPATGYSSPGDVLIGAIFPVHVDRVSPPTPSSAAPFMMKPGQLTCQKFSAQNYQWLRAMVFAIEEINRNPDLLPNVTLGFQIYDSCTVLQLVLEGTLRILTGQEGFLLNYRCQGHLPLAGIVGDAGSSNSILMARVLGVSRHPQISYFSTSPLLSDRIQFPSFFRTIPSDDFQSRGLAQLVIHFGWTWVGLLATDNDYGQQGIQITKQELIKAGACVAFTENIVTGRVDRNAFHIAQVVKNSTANAIVVFCSEASLIPVMDEMVRQNVTGKIWIASEAWSTSALLSMEKYQTILTGTIGFAIHSGEMQGFEEHLASIHPSRFPDDIFVNEFWETVFHCKWPSGGSVQGSWENGSRPCTGHEKLEFLDNIFNDLMNPRVTYNVYSAAYIIALALQDLNTCLQGGGPFPHGSCADIGDFQPWQLLHYIKRVHFRNPSGTEGFFDSSGNLPTWYDILNWQRGPEGTLRHVKVGSYNASAPPGRNLLIDISAVIWGSGSTQIPLSVCSPSCRPGFRKATRPGEPLCCFQCVPCPQGDISNQTGFNECSRCPWDQWPNAGKDTCIQKTVQFLSYDEPLGAILATTSISSSVIPVAILGLFIHHRNTAIVKANNRSLSYLLLLSLTLCFLCSLAFIGYPTPGKCLLRQAAFGITFALCVSCILAKTIMVVIAFNATKPNSDLRRWVGLQLSYTIISVCTLIQVLLCVSWLILSPPFSEYNTYTQPGQIIVECNEGCAIAFWCMLGYLGLLATISFIMAFLARNLPDSFNEAKFITFSMLAFLSVWISFIPAYLSTRGKYMVAMEIFAILSSSLALVSCIFFTKCLIILVRPEMNTKEHLMGKGASHKGK